MAVRGQGRMERRRGERRTRRLTHRMWFILGSIVLGLVVILGALIAFSLGESGNGDFPQIGDHWHASYTITVCGENERPFPASEGGIHTHGSGSIHMHPKHDGESGRNANMARFLAGANAKLTNTSLKLPSGVEYTNGDLCPDEQAGQMFLIVNGTTITNITSYVPGDQDVIQLGFGTP